MYIINSEYLNSRNQDFVQMCNYLVLYDCLLPCYFYCCIIVLVVVLLAVVVIVLLSPKSNIYLNTHCASVKSVPHNHKILYHRHVCNCRLNDRVSYTKCVGKKYSVSLYHSLCGPSVTISKHAATVLSCYHINITLTQSHVPSVNTQLQSCHVAI